MERMGSKLKHYTSFSDYIYAQKNLKCLDEKNVFQNKLTHW